MRFIADNDTSSIIAIGADDLDRQTIKELIELWDVPEPTNGKDVPLHKTSSNQTFERRFDRQHYQGSLQRSAELQ